MNDLAERLRAWTDAAEAVTAQEAMVRGRSGGPRRRAVASVAAAAMAVAAGAAAFATRSDGGAGDFATGATATTEAPPSAAVPGEVEVSVVATLPASIHVTAGDFRLGPTTEAPDAWGHHVIRYENHGNVDVSFDDTRTAQVISQPAPALVAGDEGCGPEAVPNGNDVTGGCLLNRRPFIVPAGGSTELTMTVWRDLPGLAPPEPGLYLFAKQVRFTEVLPGGVLDWAASTTGSIEVTYTLR